MRQLHYDHAARIEDTSKPLDAELNAAIVHLVDKLLPQGFDVSPNAPSSFEALKAQYDCGRMVVWDGASDDTVFAEPRVNYAFRAWHDLTHIVYQCPFTIDGESEALNMQLIDLLEFFPGIPTETMARWKAILVAEVDGQGEYNARYGRFPVNQRAFVEAYLVDKRDALNRKF